MPIGQSDLENPSLRLFFQIRLVYVKLTIKLATRHMFQIVAKYYAGLVN